MLKCIYRERAAISLSDALTSTPHQAEVFSSSTIELVASSCARFSRIAEAYDVPEDNIIILATEAMRRAANAIDMCKAILNSTRMGISIHVLSPQVETLFGAVMGCRSAIAVVRGGLCLDLGGGSLQMTWVNTNLEDYEKKAASAGRSMPFGAAMVTRTLCDPVKNVRTAMKETLQARMADTFKALYKEIPSLRDAINGEGVDLYLCGGGFRGYGYMLMHSDLNRPYPIPSIAGYRVHGEMFKMTKQMLKTNEEYGGKIFGLSTRRRSQFEAITTVVDALVQEVSNIRTATFCAGSNREGALLMMLPKTIREAEPQTHLARYPPNNPSAMEVHVTQLIIELLRSALPTNMNPAMLPCIFNAGVERLFVQRMWEGCGGDAKAKATAVLQETLLRDPDAPGLSHLSRTVFSLTLSSRWSLTVAPAAQPLRDTLCARLDGYHDSAGFWATYIGAVACVVATLLPRCPRSVEQAGTQIQ
jgi:retrograde regulation protein 2